jgi:hypothetical protein
MRITRRHLGVLAILTSLAAGAVAMDRTGAAASRRYFDAARQAEEFIGYAKSIVLTPAQLGLRDRVLERIPAACCSKFSARTCCCPCNLAKTVWGLSAFLIVRQGANAAALEEGVRSWLAFVNPRGFSGKACDEPGGCSLPFSRDGCGGMHDGNLVAGREALPLALVDMRWPAWPQLR